MKNEYIKIGILSLLLAISAGACKKFLEVNPDMRTEINSVEKLGLLLVSAYPDRNYITFTEISSDNAEDKSGVFSSTHTNEPFVSGYNWNVIEGSGNGTPGEYWDASYRAISAANQALEAIEKNNFGAKANQYKGEALVARAYATFMLVTFFSEPYEIGGANAGLGIPYPLVPETLTRPSYDRGTVASVYAQIRKDLEEGLVLLKGAVFKVPHYHFSEQAAKAFASRFYLFTGDWDKAVANVSGIYSDGDFKSKIRQYTGSLYSLSATDHSIEFTKAEKSWNLLLASTYSFFQRNSFATRARYGYGENVRAFTNGTTVFGASFRNRTSTSNGAPNYFTYKYNEYFFITNVQANIGQPYMMTPLLTADEALLNRAEAYIRLGKDDPSFYNLAIKDFNDFASTRIVSYNQASHGLTLAKAKAFFNVTDDHEAMLQTILHVKRHAFFHEGMRWMDILRFRLPVTHNFFDADQTQTFKTLEVGDKRRVFQIPQHAIEAGIIPNPR